MKNIGLDANLMSLGGLAISIGMIIDATIIQVENVQRHLSEMGCSGHKLSTVLRAVLEVRKPSIFGELIIATTFIPILSLEGLEGKMFGPLALTVTIALLSSLLLSIFAIPALCALLLRPGPEKESPVMRGARAVYRPLLAWALRGKYMVISGALAALIAAMFVVTRLGTEFIPNMDEGAFDMDVQLLPASPLPRPLILRISSRRSSASSRIDDRHFTNRTNGHRSRGARRGQNRITGIFKPRSEWKTAADRRWNDKQDEERSLRNSGDGIQLQSAHTVSHRRACGRNASAADCKTVRR